MIFDAFLIIALVGLRMQISRADRDAVTPARNLVFGLALHNTTEGIAVVAPLAAQRPRSLQLLAAFLGGVAVGLLGMSDIAAISYMRWKFG